MSVKLIMTWDIKPGLDQDYFEFVVREWVPGITRLGVETTGAWLSIYRRDDSTPRLMAEAVAEEPEEFQHILESTDWQQLHEKLLTYVDNYKQKIVEINSGDFQL